MRIKLVWILVIAILLISCGGESPDAGKQSRAVRIGILKGPTAMSLIPMLDNPGKPLPGNFQKKFFLKPSPVLLRPLLLQEELDMAIIPTTLAAILYNKQLPYRAAAVTIHGTLSLVGKNKDITSWQDLKGKQIHLMGKGMTPDILFRFLLRKNNLDAANDLELKYTFPDPMDLAQATAAGQVELAVLSEPMASTVRLKNPEINVIMDLTDEWDKLFNHQIPLAQTVLVIHRDFASKNPDTVTAFLKEYQTALQWVNSHPQEAGRLIAKYRIIPDPDAAAKAIPLCHFKFEKTFPIKDKIIKYLEIFHGFNPLTVGGKLPDETFFLEN